MDVQQQVQIYPTSLYKTSVPPPEKYTSLTNGIRIFTAIPNIHHRHYTNLLLILLRDLSIVTHLRSGSCHYAITMYSRTAENDWYSLSLGTGFESTKTLTIRKATNVPHLKKDLGKFAARAGSTKMICNMECRIWGEAFKLSIN